jgi:hypothetical protein
MKSPEIHPGKSLLSEGLEKNRVDDGRMLMAPMVAATGTAMDGGKKKNEIFFSERCR